MDQFNFTDYVSAFGRIHSLRPKLMAADVVDYANYLESLGLDVDLSMKKHFYFQPFRGGHLSVPGLDDNPRCVKVDLAINPFGRFAIYLTNSENQYFVEYPFRLKEQRRGSGNIIPSNYNSDPAKKTLNSCSVTLIEDFYHHFNLYGDRAADLPLRRLDNDPYGLAEIIIPMLKEFGSFAVPAIEGMPSEIDTIAEKANAFKLLKPKTWLTRSRKNGSIPVAISDQSTLNPLGQLAKDFKTAVDGLEDKSPTKALGLEASEKLQKAYDEYFDEEKNEFTNRSIKRLFQFTAGAVKGIRDETPKDMLSELFTSVISAVDNEFDKKEQAEIDEGIFAISASIHQMRAYILK